MKTVNSFGIHFFLKRYKERQNGTIPIYARITINGNSKDFSVRRGVIDLQWCSKLGRALSNNSTGKTLNAYLDSVATEVRDCYEELIESRRKSFEEGSAPLRIVR